MGGLDLSLLKLTIHNLKICPKFRYAKLKGDCHKCLQKNITGSEPLYTRAFHVSIFIHYLKKSINANRFKFRTT